ncbi:hypothetical protein LT493_13260 [Streptomyces tricolor]|nr:hypothetical protein [Streptomyces tricolor]
MRTDGTGLRRLTNTPSTRNSRPCSPDGRRLAYAGDGDASAGQQIYVRRLAGGTATPGHRPRERHGRRNRCGTRSTTPPTGTSSRTPPPGGTGHGCG